MSAVMFALKEFLVVNNKKYLTKISYLPFNHVSSLEDI